MYRLVAQPDRFRSQFGFQPLTDRKPAKPILLAGLPGAGKSSTLAKLAARAKVNGLAEEKLRAVV